MMSLWRVAYFKHSFPAALFVVFSFLFLSGSCFAGDNDLEPIKLQLRWQHQFQFAGYYAAIEQGYYRDAGLDVTLVEGGGARNVINEVLSGRVEYGVSNSELLLHRLKGKPLVTLAAIFQHSPLVFISRLESGITTPQDFIGKTVKMNPGSSGIELHATLANENVFLDEINLIEGVTSRKDFYNPDIEVLAGYRTNQPFFYIQDGISFTLIKPSTYGVDFYGDCLFTHEHEIRKNPERVKAFREASLKGWQYALDHPDELIQLISKKYNPRKDQKHLLFEADEMHRLILPQLVQLGHMNPDRWHHIAETFAKFGYIEKDFNLDGFLYDPKQSISKDLFQKYMGTLSLITLVLLLVVVTLFLVNRRLQREISVRKETEKALQESEKKLQNYSKQTEQFSLSAASMLNIRNEKKLYAEISNAIIEHSDFERVLISLFGDEQPYRQLIGYAGVSKELVEKVRQTDLSKSWYDNVFSLGIKIGNNSYYIPHYLSHILNQEATIFGNGEVPEDDDRWHPKDNLFVRMSDEKGKFLGVISVDNSKSGRKPTAEIVRPLEIYASLISQIIILRREYSRRTKLEQQLRQSQKMEALGNLTGGIAHDFNNILGIIIGNAELALIDTPELDPVKNNVKEIKSASLRARDIIRKLLSFNKNASTEQRAIALGPLVDDTLKLLESTIPENINLHWDSGLDSIRIMADPPLIYQVLLNLTSNAVQAMYPDGGELNLTGKVENLSDAFTASLSLQPGLYAKITVQDTGCGIAKALHSKIFDPYFTTNQSEGYSGLGLSAAHGIMKSHKGAITVNSEPGNGATFTLYFPCLTEEIKEKKSGEIQAVPTPGGSILLVADETALLDVTKNILTRNGYQVISCEQPKEALKIYSQKPEKYRLLITDMRMNGMNGLELIEQIRIISPELPVFLCTGFSERINEEQAGQYKINRYFPKPLDSEKLLEAVRETIGM